MKWNPTSKSWEVSLRLHPQDLENAMQVETNRASIETSKTKATAVEKIGIEDKEFDGAVLEFIESHLFLQRTPTAMTHKELTALMELNRYSKRADAAEQRSRLKWIGKEQEKGWIWLHLEMTPPTIDPVSQKLWLIHDVLIDHVARQENTMAVDPTVNTKFSLQFKSDTTIQEFKQPVGSGATQATR
jgi:hypothetical protein